LAALAASNACTGLWISRLSSGLRALSSRMSVMPPFASPPLARAAHHRHAD
jgi:hypothetical protein